MQSKETSGKHSLWGSFSQETLGSPLAIMTFDLCFYCSRELPYSKNHQHCVRQQHGGWVALRRVQVPASEAHSMAEDLKGGLKAHTAEVGYGLLAF